MLSFRDATAAKMMRSFISASLAFCCLVSVDASAASPEPKGEGLNLSSKRALIVPAVRAATGCIAQEVRTKRQSKSAEGRLRAIADGVASCRREISNLIGHYDRVYGFGTGRKFVDGAYLQDLPRAIAARLREDGPKSPKLAKAPELSVARSVAVWDLLQSWRLMVGERVRIDTCGIVNATIDGMACTDGGPARKWIALLNTGMKTKTLKWAMATCRSSEPPPACTPELAASSTIMVVCRDWPRWS